MTQAEHSSPGKRTAGMILIPLAVLIASVVTIAGIILLGDGDETAPQAEAPPSVDPGSTLLAGAVTPGEHTVSVFNPPLSLNIGDGWNALFDPDDDLIVLDGPALFVITRVEQVWDKESQSRTPVPEDLIRWFRSHEDFRVDEPVELTIDGYSSRRVDLTAITAADTLHFPPGEYLRIGTDDRSRVVVIDVDGTQVAAITTAEAQEFDAAIAQSQPIVESIRFQSTGEDSE